MELGRLGEIRAALSKKKKERRKKKGKKNTLHPPVPRSFNQLVRSLPAVPEYREFCVLEPRFSLPLPPSSPTGSRSFAAHDACRFLERRRSRSQLPAKRLGIGWKECRGIRQDGERIRDSRGKLWNWALLHRGSGSVGMSDCRRACSTLNLHRRQPPLSGGVYFRRLWVL